MSGPDEYPVPSASPSSADDAVASGGASEPDDSAAYITYSFVEAYYKALKTNPETLHRFYDDDSVFARVEPTPNNELTDTFNAFGQQGVYEKMQVYGDSRVKFHSIDCQFSSRSSVLILVTGEMSNKGSAPRSFVQTFVLARPDYPDDSQGQGDRYYVRNDLLRFTAPAHEAKVSSPRPASPVAAAAPASPRAPVLASPASPRAAAPASPRVAAPASPRVATPVAASPRAATPKAKASEPTETLPPSIALGVTRPEATKATSESKDAASTGSGAAAAASADGKEKKGPTRPPQVKNAKNAPTRGASGKKGDKAADAAPATAAAAAAAAPANSTDAAAEAEKREPKASTWARLVAKSAATSNEPATWKKPASAPTKKPVAPAAPAAPAATPAPAAAVAAPAAEPKLNGAAHADADDDADADDAENANGNGFKSQHRRNDRKNIIYVSGYPEDATEPQFVAIFKRFGRVEKVDIVPSKRAVFIHFSETSSADAAVDYTDPLMMSGRQLSVDHRRRTKPYKPRYDATAPLSLLSERGGRGRGASRGGRGRGRYQFRGKPTFQAPTAAQ